MVPNAYIFIIYVLSFSNPKTQSQKSKFEGKKRSKITTISSVYIYRVFFFVVLSSTLPRHLRILSVVISLTKKEKKKRKIVATVLNSSGKMVVVLVKMVVGSSKIVGSK